MKYMTYIDMSVLKKMLGRGRGKDCIMNLISTI